MINEARHWLYAIMFLVISVILLGLMIVRDFILSNFYDYKLSKLEKSYDYEVSRLAVLHLTKLKEKYPELEITFNDEVLGDD